MELTHEQFAQITGVTYQPPIYEAGDRRQHPRMAFGTRARMYPLVPAICPEGRSVLVRDLSLAGVGLLFSDGLGIGDEIILQLPVQSGEPLIIHCMVQRCEAGGSFGKQFVLGCTFEQVLDASVLTDDSMLGSPLVQSALANLAPAWKTPQLAEPADPAGPITRAVTAVWRRFSRKAETPTVEPKIRERLQAPVIEAPVVEDPTAPRRSSLFATVTTAAAVIEMPAVIEPKCEPEPVALPPEPVTLAPEPVTLPPLVEEALPPVQAPETIPLVELKAEPAIEPVQAVMWSPSPSALRAVPRKPRGAIHRPEVRHPRRRRVGR